MKKIRILVADDEHLIREGVIAILSQQKDIMVVGEARDGIEAVEITRKTMPDVILLDMVMPRQDGLSTIPQLVELNPAARILVLTSFAEANIIYQSIKAGALGYLLKDATRAQLLKAIRDVNDGKASIPPDIAMKVIHEINHPADVMYTSDPLTPREAETLHLITRGLSNHEIADILVVHERTVAKYVSNILGKLHLANRTQAALYAIQKGGADSKQEQQDSRKSTRR
jgi:two-component system, NarL family, response regulator LiaR